MHEKASDQAMGIYQSSSRRTQVRRARTADSNSGELSVHWEWLVRDDLLVVSLLAWRSV